MLKVSVIYLEKQKSFLPKKYIFLAVVSKYAKMELAVLIFCESYAWMLQRCYTKVVMENKEFQRNTNYNSKRAKIQKSFKSLKSFEYVYFLPKILD